MLITGRTTFNEEHISTAINSQENLQKTHASLQFLRSGDDSQVFLSENCDVEIEIPDSQPYSIIEEGDTPNIKQNTQTPLDIQQPESLLDFFPNKEINNEPQSSTDSQFNHNSNI